MPRMARQKRRAATGAAAILDRQTAIDGWHEIEDLAMLAADQPVDARRRKRAAKGGGHWNRVHDVAERAETDDQEARQQEVMSRRVVGR